MAKKKVSLKKESALAQEGAKNEGFRFPQNLLDPIGNFLTDQIKKLEFRKKALEKEDPFEDSSRVLENAAIDDSAAEQAGHARVSAIRHQVDRQIVQFRKALARVKIGKYGICENCGKVIDTDRLTIYPEATLCVECEMKREK